MYRPDAHGALFVCLGLKVFCLFRVFARMRSSRVKPRAVLGAVPAAIGVVVLDDRGLLLDYLGARAAARHRRAEEHVDYEHNQEEDGQGYGQPEEPARVDQALLAQRLQR